MKDDVAGEMPWFQAPDRPWDLRERHGWASHAAV